MKNHHNTTLRPVKFNLLLIFWAVMATLILGDVKILCAFGAIYSFTLASYFICGVFKTKTKPAKGDYILPGDCMPFVKYNKNPKLDK